MSSPVGLAMKMADALNYGYGCHIVVNNKSFFGKEQRPVKMYVISDSWYDSETGAWADEELFKTASGIYACYFMRDMLFSFQNKELPTDNVKWENMKLAKNTFSAINWMLANYRDVVDESEYREV